MNASAIDQCAYSDVDQPDYEKLSITDKGVVFRNSENELIWIEVEGACDALIDDALLPQDEPVTEPRDSRRRGGRRPLVLAAAP